MLIDFRIYTSRARVYVYNWTTVNIVNFGHLIETAARLADLELDHARYDVECEAHHHASASADGDT